MAVESRPIERAPSLDPIEPRSLGVDRSPRRAGLRLQLVAALGVLAIVGFVPLYLAVAGLTTHTLRQNREDAARVLGHTVAAVLAAEIEKNETDDRLRDLAAVSLDPHAHDPAIADEGILAIRIVRRPSHTEFSHAEIAVGDASALLALRALPTSTIGEHAQRANADGIGPMIAVEIARDDADIQVALRLGDQGSRAAPLLRLVAFYTASFAVVMIVLAYLLLTRVIVRPIRRVVQATRDVDAGVSRRIDPRVGRGGAAEVAELGGAIARTTARLVEREEALAAKLGQLEAARADLLAARDAIVRSERLASVGRLAAGLAHEVGNPIAALLGLEEVVLGGDLDEETRDLVARMKRETERVHRVLRDLLDFARAEKDEDGHADENATCSIAEVVEEVAALVKPQKSMRDIELEISIEDALPPVRIASARLQQVLLNLVLNAGDAIHTARSSTDSTSSVPSRGSLPSVKIGVKIGAVETSSEATLGRITVHAALAADVRYVRLEVSDDGPGVPERIRSVLFEPFVTTKEVGKGTGLGLAVCRGLVEGVGGSIRLAGTSMHDAKESGARFVVELPTPIAPPPKRSLPPPPGDSRVETKV